jgi:hypothetical protein
MGLSTGVAIVTATEIANITHEALLANLDGSDGSTIAAAAAEATNELIRRIRSRGYDPSLVDARTQTDLKAAAAFYALYSTFTALGDDESLKRADLYKKRFEEQLQNVVITTTNVDAMAGTSRPVPRVLNFDSSWGPGWGPRDTVRPDECPPSSGWMTKG